ncbi:MAG: hypothetical protein AAGF23_15870 [Acidobacteriota bacterium]
MLELVDLHLKLSKKTYQSRISALQTRLHQLQQACWKEGLATLLVFDGWTAAGKSSAIQKLTARLEPRGFDVHTIVGPRTRERQLPWLWRFWNMIPNYGHMAMFQRSWYRRVLTERIEEQVTHGQWRRAFGDINAFERTLAHDRYEIVKFFLHIDRDEQGKRLAKWRENGRGTWHAKSAPPDHEKYDAYLEAAEEMLERTETEWAPWFIVEATDKRWAFVKIFDNAVRRLEESLRARGFEVPEPFDDPVPGAGHAPDEGA